jgi:hypothetical protein
MIQKLIVYTFAANGPVTTKWHAELPKRFYGSGVVAIERGGGAKRGRDNGSEE